jgi:hypothetical protein
MKYQSANQKIIGLIAVSCVEEARRALLESGQFAACPFRDDSVIDRETGIEIRLIPLSAGN